MPDGLVVLDDSDRVVEVNDAAARIVGPEAAVVGEPAAAVFADFPEVLDRFDGDGEPDSTTIAVDLDRSTRMYAVSTVDITAGATGGGSVVAFRDVTEERVAQRRFKALVEKSSNVVMVLDEVGNLEYATPSFEDVLGYDRAEMEGTNAFDLVHPDDRERAYKAFQAAIQLGTAEVDLRVRTADGGWRRFEVIGDALFDDPVIDGMVVSARDVTERRTYEQRLRVLNRVLRHDMRNDLNVVMGHVDLLMEETTDPGVRSRLETVRQKADALLELSEDARHIDFALHDDLPLSPLDIVSVVESQVAEYREAHPDATFETDLPEEAWVRADELVESAIDNVLENAVEHNDAPHPTVEVALRAADDADPAYYELSIADDGPGIPEMDRRVLESGMETQLEHMTGLGLWLVNWIVTSSNGELDIEEREPRGTVVTLRLLCASTDEIPDGASEVDADVREGA